ncbi:MAG: NADH-quinone oxidoreductase subunit NuoK [Paludibacteraceae bacterium]
MGEFILETGNQIQIPMVAYIIVSVIMFFAGIFGFFTRKNLISLLISVELILNAVDLNFAVFNRYLYPGQLEGMFFSLFVIAIAACETAIAIAIIINIYKRFGDVNVDNLEGMKW